MTKRIILSLTLTSLFTLARISSAQTLTPLVHQPPGGANLAFQLTDGTVMCQANSSQDWYKLTPDNTGSYVNGTWTRLASLQPGYIPDDFASAVLADGRVVITGGEYNNGQFTLQIWVRSMTRSRIPGLRSQLLQVGILLVILLLWFYRTADSSWGVSWICKSQRWTRQR